MIINVVVVENDKLYSLNIESMLAELGKYNLLSVFQEVETAFPYIQKNASQIDILLLDIKLDGQLTGIDLAQKIEHLQIPVLFMTEWQDEDNYKRIASVEHFGYLAKPFHKYTLDSSIRLLLTPKLQPQEKEITEPTETLTYIRIGTKQEVIDVNSINWIESNKNYCTIYTTSKHFTVKRSLIKIYSLLPPNEFVFIHKSFIVRLSLITKIDLKAQTVFVESKQFPLGRSYIKGLRKHFVQMG